MNVGPVEVLVVHSLDIETGDAQMHR